MVAQLLRLLDQTMRQMPPTTVKYAELKVRFLEGARGSRRFVCMACLVHVFFRGTA